MPKELHEISKFMAGTVTVPSETDISDDTASYSLNIDPVAEDGILKGIPNDLLAILKNTSISSQLSAGYANGVGTILIDNGSGFTDPATAYTAYLYVVDTNGKAMILGYTDKSGTSPATFTGVTWLGPGTGNIDYNDSIFQVPNIYAHKMAMINDDGTHRVVYFDDNDDKIKKIDDIHGTVGTTATLSSSAETKSVVPTMQVNNKEVHIGMGNGVNDKPLWCGIVPHEQFGSGVSGLQLENAALYSPTNFPSLHKIVEDGSGYLYGIEYGGKFIYKFLISDKTTIYKKSKSIFTSSTAICHWDSSDTDSGFLWVFDNGQGTYGTVYKVSTEELEIVQTNNIGANPSPASSTVVQDMIETNDKLWLAYARLDDSVSANFVSNSLLYNVATPTSSAAITLTDRTPHSQPAPILANVNREGESAYLGVDTYSSTSSAPSAVTVKYRPFKNCLSVPSANASQVIWYTQLLTSGGGQAYCIYYYDFDTSVEPTWEAEAYPVGSVAGGAVAIIIKEDYVKSASATVNHANLVAIDLQDEFDDFEIISSILQLGINLYIAAYPSGNSDAVKLFSFSSNIRQYSSYVTTSYTSGLNPWNDEDPNLYHKITDGAAYAFTEGDWDTIKMAADSGSTIQLMSGLSIGKWGTTAIAFGSRSFDLISTLGLDFTDDGATNSDWIADTSYFWKCSWLYDGYQEGELSDSFQKNNNNVQPGANITKNQLIKIRLYDVASISKRISHINLYRAENSSSYSELSNKGFYRLLKSFPLDSTFFQQTSDSWGIFKEKEFVDEQTINGPSYEAVTGISEVLTDFKINYSLSAQLNNHHFIANCHHEVLANSDLLLFKSKPYNFDQFDWSQDLLRLPTKPTAIVGFNGRIYVFDDNNTYKIEPNQLYIEDTFEGAGCIGPEAVVVTEYGMCFADKNNIYLHDGNQPAPIGNSILRGDDKSWQNRDTTWASRVIFDAERNSFVVLFKYSGNYYSWVFNIARRRWDLWEVFGTTEPLGTLTGKNGEMFISDGTNLKHYLGHTSTRRNWDWYSKKLTMGTDTQTKVFKRTRVAGNTGDCIDTFVSSEGTPSDSGATDGTTGYIYTLSGPNSRAKWIQYKITAEANTVDAIGTIFRRRPIR